MAADEPDLSGLTRAMLLGAAIGTVALTQAGCAPEPFRAATAAAGAPSPALATDQELCARVLKSRSARDAEVLMRTYVNSACIPPTLAVLPPSTLAAISPAAVNGLSPAIRAQIPDETAQHLRLAASDTGESNDRGSRGGPY